MKKNIAIIGWNIKLNNKVAKTLSEKLEMFYLSLSELACYHACRPSKNTIIKEGGQKQFNKFYKKAVADAVEFNSIVISADVAEIKGDWLDRLKDTAYIVFLNQSKTELKKAGIDLKKYDTNYSRQRFFKFYNIYIDATDKSINEVNGLILNALEKLFTEA